MFHRLALVVSLVAFSAMLLAAQEPRKETVEGIRNFTRVDSTVACAGATEVSAIPELARRGYKGIINLRLASEEGADIDASRAAAEAAGLRFVHLPLDSQQPESATVDAFLEAVGDPANQPTFINCGSARRVSALMIAKRMLLDGWSEERALAEAAVIGPPSPALQAFVLEYVAARRK